MTSTINTKGNIRYKGEKIDDSFAIKFLAKPIQERQTIMDKMTEDQLEVLSEVIQKATAAQAIKEKPMIIKEK